MSSDRIAALSSDKSATFFASTGWLLELRTERRLESSNEEEKRPLYRPEAIARRRQTWCERPETTSDALATRFDAPTETSLFRWRNTNRHRAGGQEEESEDVKPSVDTRLGASLLTSKLTSC